MSANKQHKLFSEEVIAAQGKNLDALLYSRERREQILEQFDGELPQSIMQMKHESRDTDLAKGTYKETFYKGHMADSFFISGAGCAAGALSAFPQNIGRAVVQLYSKAGDTVVDPFAGHNSRMELCVKLGRHYVGCDVSAEFMKRNREVAMVLRQENPDISIKLFETDSRKMAMHVSQWEGDFTLTSPPYYDIEHYGDEYQQLGKCSSYNEFIRAMSVVAQQNFHCLKSGAFACWFINDFRRDGRFVAYHIDMLRCLTEAGFVAWDIMIVDLGSAIRAVFAQQVIDTKILPKRHEYCVVVRKP